ncbi:DUF3054 domain-containing protein [Ornithinimicrobium sp. Y1847]|uniref:DUF3054 domain-containing protein n=1 Tax=unclassified Ornithinimicrobium TaxID=2615080 RepID=UPI003B685A53
MAKPTFFFDLLVVLLFAAAGRASHELSGDVLGVLQTAWPFLVGLAVGWLAVLRQPGDRRRWWLNGIVIWSCSLVIGMLLRLATGEGTALPFVLVAAGTLALGLIGWRAVAALVGSRSGAAQA